MYEPSIRIPMIVRGPGVADAVRGKRLAPMVLGMDLHPTLLEAAGVRVDHTVHGRSFWPLVQGKKPTAWRKDFLYRFFYDGRETGLAPCEGVRTERFKYTVYYDREDKARTKPIHEQLFDLHCDPDEARNLAADPDYKRELERLRARYRELREQVTGGRGARLGRLS